ncbi:MAG: YraN family protein [Pirellulaceae bacterium]
MSKTKLNSIGRWIVSCGRFFCNVCQHFAARPPLGGSAPLGSEPPRFLQQLGYRILARSHRQRLGEIDLIALDGDCLVFVEVKTWSSGDDGDPSLAVDRRKQERLSRAALVYLKRRGLLEQQCRFDVVSIVWPAGQGCRPTIRHFPPPSKPSAMDSSFVECLVPSRFKEATADRLGPASIPESAAAA